jgi:hypothetical protein
MNEPRPVLPTDLLALATYKGRSYRNEAWTRERLGAEETQPALSLVLDQFLAFARGRSAWISVHRQRLQGLVGARKRGGKQAWEIDYLIDATPGNDITTELLERALADVGLNGAEKLFLRVAADSDLLPVVRQTGFLPYQEETLYSRGPIFEVGKPAADLRPVVPADAYLLYRFYNQTRPETVRRQESATFNEWHAAQESQWLKGGVQLVEESEGSISAWVRAARLPQGVGLDLAVSEAATQSTQAIINAALEAVGAGGLPVFILVPHSAESLAGQIEGSGFEARQDFVSLMRRTTRTQSLPLKVVPAIAETAVGV